MPPAPDASIVWARGGVRLNVCPKPYITAQSLAWIEQFFMLKALGSKPDLAWPAKTVDAFLALEEEIRKEKKNDIG